MAQFSPKLVTLVRSHPSIWVGVWSPPPRYFNGILFVYRADALLYPFWSVHFCIFICVCFFSFSVRLWLSLFECFCMFEFFLLFAWSTNLILSTNLFDLSFKRNVRVDLIHSLFNLFIHLFGLVVFLVGRFIPTLVYFYLSLQVYLFVILYLSLSFAL